MSEVVTYRRATSGRAREILAPMVPLRGSRGPHANQLSSALLALSRDRAIAVLLRAKHDGWELRDVEEVIIAPAVSRLGELWLRGRIDDDTFNRAGALAEAVEILYRRTAFQPASAAKGLRRVLPRN